MSFIELKNISKRYKGNSTNSVTDFNLEIEEGEFVAFVGPSGCGKSTTLRMIAGFEDITSGELWINGKLMNQVKPGDRGISMVFQNYALYPHMTVEKNISYGLSNMKLPKDESKRKRTGLATSSVWKNCANANRKTSPAVSASVSLSGARSSKNPICF